MSNILTRLFFVAIVALLVLGPPTTGRVYSQQRNAGVASGGRVAREGSRDSHAPGTRRSSSERNASEDDVESVPAISTRRLRELESLEQQCVDEVNRVRRARGLTGLEMYEQLLPIAREYSRRMAEEHFFSHTDPEGRTVRERVDEAEVRWRMVGENLAYSNGYVNPVAASLRGWMESPGHRRNILDPDFNRTAVGVWVSSNGTVYFTEIFLKQ